LTVLVTGTIRPRSASAKSSTSSRAYIASAAVLAAIVWALGFFGW
jgi:hypothetical protein